MYQALEQKIRSNALAIYLVVALIFVGILIYIFRSERDIDDQKQSIREYYQELSTTYQLINKVHRAQSEVNQYIASPDPARLNVFQENLAEVEDAVQALKPYAQDSSQLAMLSEVKVLLKEKGDIVLRLGRLFDENDYQHKLDELSLLYEEMAAGKDAGALSARLKKDYTRHILLVESQVRQLLHADHEISLKISNTLMSFYDHIVQSRLKEIKKSDDIVSKNSVFSLVTGIVALISVLILILLIFQDVNRGYVMRHKLQKANRRIKQTMESRHRLLLSVSHDVKTPLNSILGYLELNREDKTFSDEEIQAMQNSGKHILALLNNLLYFSSLEQGTLKKEEGEFSLDACCREIKDMFLPLVTRKGLNWEVRFNFRPDTYLLADELRIKQILGNLLSNAVKYTPEGSIEWEMNCRNAWLEMRITDTGVGIPHAQIAELYKPFFRVEQHAALAEGTGCGLYVVKGLVDMLEGKIHIRSKEGKGTTVWVQLPVREIEKRSDDSPKKVWIIDDDPAFLELLYKMLQRLGHEPKSFHHLKELENRLSKPWSCDILLTDMEMGAVSGLDVLAMVKRDAPGLPVVVMTAHAEYNEGKARGAGFDTYLKKPVTIESLQQLLGGKGGFSTDSLALLFGDDKEAIREILQVFSRSTRENIGLLQEALAGDDFKTTGELCHKMLPMFQQIGEEKASVLLKKIEDHRSKHLPAYAGWQEDIQELIQLAGNLLSTIDRDYLS